MKSKFIGKKFNRPELNYKDKLEIRKTLQQAKMKTIYISGGRKDKIRPGDVIGTLTALPNALSADDIGKIELHDTFTYVAVSFSVAEKALQKLTTNKIKGHKFKASYVK